MCKPAGPDNDELHKEEFMVQKKIVAVDDDPELLDFLKETLINAGYSVSGAETGRKALELIKSTKPDIVLLDLMLPDIDGLEVCKRMPV